LIRAVDMDMWVPTLNGTCYESRLDQINVFGHATPGKYSLELFG